MADPEPPPQAPPAYEQQPPSQHTGYQPLQQAGYPPQQQAGHPPQQQAGYPPQQQAGYPPQPVVPGYQQGPAAFPPTQQQQQQQATVVVTQQPVVVQQPVFRDHPVTVIDSNGQQVTTQLEYKSGALTWLICCLICWITGFWCIALIPFCIDGTKDVYHITSTDGKVVGVYKRM